MEHREKTIESWLESNPDCILEDGKVLIIGRQVPTNLSSSSTSSHSIDRVTWRSSS